MLDLVDLPILKIGVILTEESNNNVPKPQRAIAPHQIEHQPPAQDVALSSTSLPAIEHVVVVGNGSKEITLALSWVY